MKRSPKCKKPNKLSLIDKSRDRTTIAQNDLMQVNEINQIFSVSLATQTQPSWFTQRLQIDCQNIKTKKKKWAENTPKSEEKKTFFFFSYINIEMNLRYKNTNENEASFHSFLQLWLCRKKFTDSKKKKQIH